jgi:phospholipase C
MQARIDHVIVVALENRSFDHMLGYLDHPDPAFDGLTKGGPHSNPGWDGGRAVLATDDAKVVLPVGPDHSHDAVMEQLAVQTTIRGRVPTNQGFVTSYERIGRGLAPPAFGGLLGPLINWLNSRSTATPITGRGPLIMRCQPPEQVPVLATLARNFAVCTRWFCSVPGETWPNRNFLHAATSDGETNITPRLYTNPTIFERLEQGGHSWHIYYDDTPQVWAFVNLWSTPERIANWFEFPAFAEHVRQGNLPTYSFIEPNHRPPLHTLDYAPIVGQTDTSNSQHPGNNMISNQTYGGFRLTEPCDFTRGEALLANIYETLRSNPDVFNRSILLITYDEHGGLYDHVPPPTNVTNPGVQPTLLRRLLRTIYHRKSAAFDFTMLGPRVPAIVISPYVDAGTISTETHEHASVPATLRQLFLPKVNPLTSRDADANPFHTLLTRSTPRTGDLPDLSAWRQPLPTAPAPAARPAASRLGTPIPSQYQPFIGLADRVQLQLHQRQPSPASRPIPGMPGWERASYTKQLFTNEAERSRQSTNAP